MKKIILLAAILAISFYLVATHLTVSKGPSEGIMDKLHCGNKAERCQELQTEGKCCGTNCEKQPPTPPASTKELIANPAWKAVSGYSESFSQCNSLCNAYRGSACSQQTAVDYCNALFSVDLNKNGNIDSNQYGKTPIGGTTCDTNIHCYDVVQNCECPTGGQALNLGSCVQILYSSFANKGLPFVSAYSSVSSTLQGNCGKVPSRT